MKRFIFLMFVICSFALLTLPSGNANATSIIYEAVDLADTTSGEDLWQYDYSVSDYTFNTNYSFTIYFDYNLYGNLEDPPTSPNSDWNVDTWHPSTSLPDDGGYDAWALVNGASLADSFQVDFIWLGSGNPGSQPFEVYDNTWNVIESGNTAPIPEPGTILLVGSGLLWLVGLKRKQKQWNS
jgi:PEP-CTERM motif